MNRQRGTSAVSAEVRGPAALTGGNWGAAWAKAVALVEATKLRSVFLLGFVGLASGLWGRGALESAADQGSAVATLATVRLVLGTVAVALGSMGANAITGAIDHRMDATMSRTRHRPIPTGRITPMESLWFGVALVAVAVVLTLLTGHLWSTVWLLAGVLDVTLLYNGWSKPRTPWSVVLGSPAGGAPVLVVTSAVTGAAASPAVLILAGLVVVWTPIHVWSLAIRYVDDYRAAGVPMLPVAVGPTQAARCVGWASLALCGLSAGLPAVLSLGFWPAALVLALQAPVLAASLAVMFRPTAGRAWTLFKLTSPYLALLFIIVAMA